MSGGAEGSCRRAPALRRGRGGGARFLAGGFLSRHAAALALLSISGCARPRRGAAFGLGYFFGLGLYGAGASWVYVSLHRFGAMPMPLAATATLAWCAFLALFPALAGWLQARIARDSAPPGAAAVLLVPAAWVLMEWPRSWFLTGFPWLAVGYTAIDDPLSGFAPLGGVYAVSLATLAAAGAVVRRARPRALESAGRAGVRCSPAADALRVHRVDRAGRRAAARRARAGQRAAGDEIRSGALRADAGYLRAARRREPRGRRGAPDRAARDRGAALPRPRRSRLSRAAEDGRGAQWRRPAAGRAACAPPKETT